MRRDPNERSELLTAWAATTAAFRDWAHGLLVVEVAGPYAKPCARVPQRN